MKKLIHVPLEPYKQRYTELLKDWERDAFGKVFDVQTIEPHDTPISLNIVSGSVLDSTMRGRWALSQIQSLLSLPSLDCECVYFSDFFHPGLEALKYAGKPFTSAAFLWAQTFDRYDFTQQMIEWMRPWEYMAMEIYDYIFVACEELEDLIATTFPQFAGKLHVVGLPFDSNSVKATANMAKIPLTRTNVVYSSRWDTEKRPDVFLNLVESCPDLTFTVCSGWSELRGNDLFAINRAKKLVQKQGNLSLNLGLSKGDYYAVLNSCDVQFNCAYQDWVSFTLLEALTMGCFPVYPMFRGFPSTLLHVKECLYSPGVASSAEQCIRNYLEREDGFELQQMVASAVLTHHDGTLGRIAEILDNRVI